MAASPTPKRSMDDSDIIALENELAEEREKCHAKADVALPLAQTLKEKTDKLSTSGRVRVKTPGNPRGIRLPAKECPPGCKPDTDHGDGEGHEGCAP